MEIKAAVVFEKSGDFSLEQLELSEPRDDEVLVRIVGVGICHTDLAARDMHLPIPQPPSVFGHEGAGVVEKVFDILSFLFRNHILSRLDFIKDNARVFQRVKREFMGGRGEGSNS